MTWSIIDFGEEHIGETLPQVLFSDPDWFFWAVKNDAFKVSKNKNLSEEAKELYQKSRNIKIPNGEESDIVYFQQSCRFSHILIVPQTAPIDDAVYARKDVIDLGIPFEISRYNKGGYKQLISNLKRICFGEPNYKMTKKRCEDFFSDNKNFSISNQTPQRRTSTPNTLF